MRKNEKLIVIFENFKFNNTFFTLILKIAYNFIVVMRNLYTKF